MIPVMEYLYPCVKDKLAGYIPRKEYEESQKVIDRHLSFFKRELAEEWNENLTKLLEEYDLLHTIELEAMFQAAVSVALDLVRL